MKSRHLLLLGALVALATGCTAAKNDQPSAQRVPVAAVAATAPAPGPRSPDAGVGAAPQEQPATTSPHGPAASPPPPASPAPAARAASPPAPASPAPAANTAAPPASASASAQAAGAPVFVDVRTPQEYQAGHVEGAVLIPVDQLAQRWQELEQYHDRPIVLYCRTGHRAAIALQILQSKGMTNAENGGGLDAMATRGLQLVRE